MQIGSALGSTLGRVVRVGEARMRVLVACGAAGGIAATFNAPLAGVFFAMELILRDFDTQSFGMVVLASVTASVIGRAAFGNAPFLHLPAFTVDHLNQYLLFAALGLLAGVVGVAFTRVLYWIEDACDWAWRGPEWLRPAVGGFAARRPAAAPAGDVRRRLPGARQRHRRQVRDRIPARAAGREDRRHQPDDRHRRLRRCVRAQPVHRRDARLGLRTSRAPGRTRASPDRPAPTR